MLGSLPMDQQERRLLTLGERLQVQLYECAAEAHAPGSTSYLQPGDYGYTKLIEPIRRTNEFRKQLCDLLGIKPPLAYPDEAEALILQKVADLVIKTADG